MAAYAWTLLNPWSSSNKTGPLFENLLTFSFYSSYTEDGRLLDAVYLKRDAAEVEMLAAIKNVHYHRERWNYFHTSAEAHRVPPAQRRAHPKFDELLNDINRTVSPHLAAKHILLIHHGGGMSTLEMLSTEVRFHEMMGLLM
jgi:hypothetical protein